MTLASPGRRQLPAQAKPRELNSRATKSARKGVENGGLRLARSAAPPTVSHPHTNGQSRHGPHTTDGAARVWKTAGRATALWGARRPPFPTPAHRRSQKRTFRLTASPALPLFPPTRRLEMFKNLLDKPNPIRARP